MDVLRVYCDYQCPYCRELYHQIKKLPSDRVSIEWFHFPLTQIHPMAVDAALASEAARRQDKFAGMTRELFTIQEPLMDRKQLYDMASSLNLDMKTFKSDMESIPVKRKILSQYEEAVKSGIRGTPTLYLNGKPYLGSRDHSSILAALGKRNNLFII